MKVFKFFFTRMNFWAWTEETLTLRKYFRRQQAFTTLWTIIAAEVTFSVRIFSSFCSKSSFAKAYKKSSYKKSVYKFEIKIESEFTLVFPNFQRTPSLSTIFKTSCDPSLGSFDLDEGDITQYLPKNTQYKQIKALITTN